MEMGFHLLQDFAIKDAIMNGILDGAIGYGKASQEIDNGQQRLSSKNLCTDIIEQSVPKFQGNNGKIESSLNGSPIKASPATPAFPSTINGVKGKVFHNLISTDFYDNKGHISKHVEYHWDSFAPNR